MAKRKKRKSSAPVQWDKSWLRAKTDDVIGFAYRQACDMVRIGAILNEVRKTIGHGEYTKWVARELPFSYPHAHRLRQVARAFAAFQARHFDRFAPSALYVLAQTKGVTAETRNHAVALAEQGEKITHARALEIIAANRPIADLDDNDLDRYDRKRRKGEAVPVLLEDGSIKTDKKGRPILKVAADETERREEWARDRHVAIGDMISEALRDKFGNAVKHKVSRLEIRRLHVTTEEGDDESKYVFSVSVVRDDRTTETHNHLDLRVALENAFGIVRMKHCGGPCCPLPTDVRPITDFSRSSNHPDGLLHWCKKCENARKKRDRDKKKQTELENMGCQPSPIQPSESQIG